MTLKGYNTLLYANHAVLWLNGTSWGLGDSSIEQGAVDFL